MSASSRGLPLRLWAAAHTGSLSPGSKPFIVEVATGVCAVLTSDGVAALVVEGEPSLPPAVATAPLPMLRRSSEGKASWSGRSSALPALATTAALAELLVNSLRHYWSRQVREPSVRGFLSILSKQFSASHLYLFELLQNAVDEGATSVVVERTSHSSLSVAHDGRRFAPLDVVGLSSVGLSTKAGRSAIGCMGIGFKAVFRRWSEVTVRDGRWGFRFEKHAKGRDATLPDHAWVLLPQWVPPPARAPLRPEWCRFELAKPTAPGWSSDLRGLPRGAPVLLGRAALARGAKSFALNWDGRKIVVEQESAAVIRADGARWLFVSAPVVVDAAAAAAYKLHTKVSVVYSPLTFHANPADTLTRSPYRPRHREARGAVERRGVPLRRARPWDISAPHRRALRAAPRRASHDGQDGEVHLFTVTLCANPC